MSPNGPVVCGYDGSPNADAALEWAGREACRRGVLLQVVTAVDLAGMLIAPGLPPAVWPGDDALLVAARQDAGRAAAAVSHATGCRSETVVAVDSAARLLQAISPGAALVVVGSRGRGGFSQLLLGSVSEAVAEHSRCPVVVVRQHSEPGQGPFSQAVMLGVDGSAGAAAAAAFAFAFADRRRLNLVALYAQPVPPALVGHDSSSAPQPIPEPAAEVDALLQDAVRRGRATYPDVPVRAVAWRGQPVEVLTGVSADAELLVVGSRGRSTLAAALLGSVSRGILRHATCPVAVVPDTH